MRYIGAHSRTIVVQIPRIGWYVSKTTYEGGTHAVIVPDPDAIIDPDEFAAESEVKK